MIHKTWNDNQTLKEITCVNTDAEKFTVTECLTVGKTYQVKNETEEFYFVIDDTGKMGGFYKNYFEE
ncbi:MULTISPECIES: DUF6501 family protein [Allobacillus]|uniref:Uncharacterized protein n=1 Tax=Allobacillus salarius TaxID=1955272 RepID=A0A556PT01_9BACI|nr:DUF6501 family protein [Allobacillus salarius]TSJ67511.1 hypothetical protein FPQ13_00120 [Allobacillus salarius]